MYDPPLPTSGSGETSSLIASPAVDVADLDRPLDVGDPPGWPELDRRRFRVGRAPHGAQQRRSRRERSPSRRPHRAPPNGWSCSVATNSPALRRDRLRCRSRPGRHAPRRRHLRPRGLRVRSAGRPSPTRSARSSSTAASRDGASCTAAHRPSQCGEPRSKAPPRLERLRVPPRLHERVQRDLFGIDLLTIRRRRSQRSA